MKQFTHKMKQFYTLYETREAHTEIVPAVHITLTKDNIVWYGNQMW